MYLLMNTHMLTLIPPLSLLHIKPTTDIGSFTIVVNLMGDRFHCVRENHATWVDMRRISLGCLSFRRGKSAVATACILFLLCLFLLRLTLAPSFLLCQVVSKRDCFFHTSSLGRLLTTYGEFLSPTKFLTLFNSVLTCPPYTSIVTMVSRCNWPPSFGRLWEHHYQLFVLSQPQMKNGLVLKI